MTWWLVACDCSAWCRGVPAAGKGPFLVHDIPVVGPLFAPLTAFLRRAAPQVEVTPASIRIRKNPNVKPKKK